MREGPHLEGLRPSQTNRKSWPSRAASRVHRGSSEGRGDRTRTMVLAHRSRRRRLINRAEACLRPRVPIRSSVNSPACQRVTVPASIQRTVVSEGPRIAAGRPTPATRAAVETTRETVYLAHPDYSPRRLSRSCMARNPGRSRASRNSLGVGGQPHQRGLVSQ